MKRLFIANKEYFYPSRFTRHDVITLCLAIFIPVTAIVLTLVAVLPALGAPPLPNFEDPTKVFYLLIQYIAGVIEKKPQVISVLLQGRPPPFCLLFSCEMFYYK